MSERKKVNVHTLRAMKKKGEKIVMLTAYDFQTALLEDRAGVDMMLVGDSLGMVVLGHDTTVPVTVDDIVHHLRGVSAADPKAMVVGDLPFMSYQASVDDAVRNAGRLLKEGGAEAVKLEGGRRVAPMVEAIIAADIPLMGHIGLTPQSYHRMGGFKVQGKTEEEADRLLAEAKYLESAGCFGMVLEGMPSDLARTITAEVSIPTIGIGAGPECDGQVLVVNDILGMSDGFSPKFVKRYADIGAQIQSAVSDYIADVRAGSFPDDDHSYS